MFFRFPDCWPVVTKQLEGPVTGRPDTIVLNFPVFKKMLHGSTEHCSRAVNTPASYSGGPGFKSRPGDRLSWLEVFRGFPQFL
jgi:hypothetical protein